MPVPEQILQELELERRRLEDHVVKLNARIKEINDLVGHARKLAINWQESAMKCIRGATAPLTTDEILRCVFQQDLDDLSNPIRRRNYIMQLSLALNRLVGKKLICSVSEPGYKGKFHYPKNWECSPGILRTEYRIPFQQKLESIKREKEKSYG